MREKAERKRRKERVLSPASSVARGSRLLSFSGRCDVPCPWPGGPSEG